MWGYKEKYTISELIAKLQEIKEKEWDINVCISEKHEYWWTVYRYASDYDIRFDSFAQPHWPKNWTYEKSLVIWGRY